MDNRPTTHRVFGGGSPIKLSGPNVFQATDIGSAYRLTGSPQIQDIIKSGTIRAKEGKIKGGRIGEVHWSAGHPKLAYAASPATESYVLQTPINKLQGKQGGVPVSGAKIWHSPVGTTSWFDVTEDISKSTGIGRRSSFGDILQTRRELQSLRPWGAYTYQGGLQEGLGGFYRPQTREIFVNTSLAPDVQRKVKRHEFFHDIQAQKKAGKIPASFVDRLTFPSQEAYGKAPTDPFGAKLKWGLSELASETQARVAQEGSLKKGFDVMLKEASGHAADNLAKGRPVAAGVFRAVGGINTAREAGRNLLPAARQLGAALGTEAASVGRMALRGAGRLAGPVGLAMTAYDLAQAFPAPAPISEEDMGKALRSYRTGPQPAY